jgi:hypothetical protein
LDLPGGAVVVVANVLYQRAYPGGPARPRFVGFHGPDREPIGSFTISGPAGVSALQIMREGVNRMDAMFSAALQSGRLIRDTSLDIPLPPPPPPEEIIEEVAPTAPTAQRVWSYQVQIVAKEVNDYNFAMAHLRTTAGVEGVAVVAVNPTGVSYVNVTYRGDVGNLRSALIARGWAVTQTGFVLRMSSTGERPPALPPPPPPAAPPPAQPTATPQQPQPQPGTRP